MTTRDRMVLIVIGFVAVLGAAWMLVVSPERKQVTQLDAKVSAARAQLASAEGQVASARAAQSQYSAAYSAVVDLGKAVPPSQEVPALIYQLSQASNEKDVNFDSISSGGGAATPSSSTSGSTSSSSSSSATSASTGATAAAAGASGAGFSQLPFSFTFEGSYFDLEHLFHQLTGFATMTNTGTLQVSGRLLTIESVKLAPSTTASSPGGNAISKLTGSIAATAYVLPATEGLTGSATATSPTGATTPATATGTTSGSSPTPSATVKVNP
jgi:Tfp pilus assembly protein PilO